MNKYDAERAIIANRPGEPFVLVERVDGNTISALSALDWQARTVPPTWGEVVSWVGTLASAETARTIAVNQGTLLRQRNRWLAQTDPYMLPVAAFPTDTPAEIKTAISNNLDAIRIWRQKLRDWPATVTDWTQPGELPAPPTITLASGRSLIILT